MAIGEFLRYGPSDGENTRLRESQINLIRDTVSGLCHWIFGGRSYVICQVHKEQVQQLPLLDGIGLLAAQVHCGKLVNLLVQNVVREIRSESHPTSFSSALLQHLHGPAACSGDAVGAGVEVAGGLEPGEEPGR